MDTILPLPFLPSLTLANGTSEFSEGLSRVQLSYLGCVFLTATDANIDVLLQFLQEHITIEAYVDTHAISSTDDIVTILDAGARKIYVNPAQREALRAYQDRVIPIFDVADNSSDVSYPDGTLYLAVEDETINKASLNKLVESKTSPVYIASSSNNLESYVKVAQGFGAIPIIPTTKLTIDKDSKDLLSVPTLIGSSWTSDRIDKLIPTVVTDEGGIALGLVYSSQESLAESLKTGTGVYQSRKRGLWYKGATSGDTQELVRISLDCDQDCLKYVVRQRGRGMH
jgi:phosphoribosyl-ATP pyrophosphohydrolase/phosphoribosyl-AMP cyclohydrolase/histidinol dehydrogenase